MGSGACNQKDRYFSQTKKYLTEENEQKFMVKDFCGSGLQFEAPQYQNV
jgi:hypothetical protein